MNSEQDIFFMNKAIELAKQGRGRTGINPLSGAILVKNNEVVGEGFQTSNESAEANAIRAGKKEAQDSTLYVVVEPALNKSVDLIKNTGIKRVVVSMTDPNISSKGKGITALFDAKIEVLFGVEEAKSLKLNETFTKYYSLKTPFVNMLSFSTLDGKSATIIGDREWLVGDEARNTLHDLRASYDAVLVGVNTVIRDNPQLSCKANGGKDPTKVIIDTYGKTPLNSKIFIKSSRDDIRSNVIIAVSGHATEERIKSLTAAGAEVVVCADEKYADEKYSKVDLKKVLSYLGKKGYVGLITESGGNLNAALLEENLVDKITFFITPKIVGGKEALTPVEGTGISLMSQAIELKDVNYTKLGNDLMIDGYLRSF